jgi:hypothetical protein
MRTGTGYAYDPPRTDTVTAKCEGCGTRIAADAARLSRWVTACSTRCTITAVERRWHFFYQIAMRQRPLPDWLRSYADECQLPPDTFVKRAVMGWEMELVNLRGLR